jgi:hypothetical protein
MTKKEYNGFEYNNETWQANRWCSEIFTSIAAETYEQDPSVSLEDLTEILAGAFENAFEEISGIAELPNGFVKDVALTAWGEINWDSIAEHYAQDVFELAKR